jgi:ubiquinone/menaquinone biosynthesis C-methylase UbiE
MGLWYNMNILCGRREIHGGNRRELAWQILRSCPERHKKDAGFFNVGKQTHTGYARKNRFCPNKEVMKTDKRKDFDKEAATWDQNPGRIKLANDVADTIMREIKLTGDMDVLDFGCGTGLVTLRLQPFVKTITGADSSKGMLDVLQDKVSRFGLKNVEVQVVDLEMGGLVAGKFHAVVSSMTLHHIQDPAQLFRKLRDFLHSGGTLCISDLDKEDGSFHSDKTGVLHFGFERPYLKGLLENAGFHEVRDVTAAAVTKDIEGTGEKTFTVFLIIGKK